MTITELSEYLKVPVTTLYAWNSEGSGPAYHKVGRHVRYARADVAEWMKRGRTSGQ